MRLLTLLLILNPLQSFERISTYATATYVTEFYKLSTQEQFGEMADPSQEERDVDEFEVLASISLKKIGVQFNKEIMRSIKKSGIRLQPYNDELSSGNTDGQAMSNHTFRVKTSHIRYNHLNLGELFLTISTDDMPTADQQLFVMSELERVLQTKFSYSKLEMSLLSEEAYSLDDVKLTPDEINNYDLPSFSFYEDFSFNTFIESAGDLPEDEFSEEGLLMITGAWEINDGNELILYYPDYASPHFEDPYFRTFRINKVGKKRLIITESE